MKRQILAVAIGSLFALPAFADGEIGYDFRTVAKAESSKTRAQVQAELVAAQATRGYVDGEIGSTVNATVSNKSRAEVMAEIDSQRAADGEIGSPLPHA
ncbi:MAG: DUF4148 domain-containing protein [Burkholderiales bacterium]